MIRARQFLSVGVFIVTVMLTVNACGKKVPPQTPAPPPPPVATAPPPPPPPAAPPPPRPAAAPVPAPLTEDQIFARKSLEQLNTEHPLADVYFDLDDAVIRSDGRGPLQTNSDWLK